MKDSQYFQIIQLFILPDNSWAGFEQLVKNYLKREKWFFLYSLIFSSNKNFMNQYDITEPKADFHHTSSDLSGPKDADRSTSSADCSSG